jgi:hypothetical protein
MYNLGLTAAPVSGLTHRTHNWWTIMAISTTNKANAQKIVVFDDSTSENVGSQNLRNSGSRSEAFLRTTPYCSGNIFGPLEPKGTPRPDEVPKTGVFCKITVMARRFLTRNHHFDIAGASNCSHNSLK